MDLNTNYGKTGRGLRASTKKLPKDAGRVLSVLDSDLTAKQILFKLPKMKAKDFEEAMSWLLEGGFIKAVDREEFPQSMWDASKLAAVEVDEIDIDQFTVSEKISDSQAEAINTPQKKRARPTVKPEDVAKIKALENADEEARKRAETALQAKLEAEGATLSTPDTAQKHTNKQENDAQRKAEEEAKEAARLIEEEERKQAEAAARAEREKKEAEEKTRKEAEVKEKAEEAARIKAEKEAEAQARREAEEKAKKEEEAKRKAEEKAAEAERKQAELETKAKAEEKARKEAEAKEKAEEAARIKAEKEAEAQARKEAEEQRKAEEKAKKEEEAKRKAEEKAAEKARKQAEKEEREKAKAEEKARKEAEAKEKAEEAARIKAEKEAEAQARKEAEEQRKAEEKAKKEEEAKRKAEEKAAEKARKQAEKEEREKAKAEEKARKEAEAKEKAEEAARIKAEKEAEEKARKEAEEQRKAEEKEQARIEAEERAILKAEQKAEAKIAAEQKALEKAAEKEHAKLEANALKAIRAKKKAEAKIEARYRRQEIISNIRDALPSANWISQIAANIKPISMFALAVLCLLIIAAQFINMSVLISPIEKVASQHIQDPVNIESVNISLFPSPHFVLKNITIADTTSINMKKVRVFPNLMILKDKIFNESASPYEINAIEIEQFNIAQKDIYRMQSWAGASTRDQLLQLKKINIDGLSFNLNKLDLPTFDVALILDSAGLIKTAEISAAENRLLINIKPAKDNYIVNIDAQRWRLPLYPYPVLTKLNASGVISDNLLQLNEIEATLYNGSLKGNFETDLSSSTLASSGKFDAENIYVGDMADELKLNTHVDGKLNISGDFILDVDKLANKIALRQLQSKFYVDDGRLRKVNIGEAMRSGNLSGITDFTSLKGNISYSNETYRFSSLALKDKQLFANGYINLTADQQVTGVINAKIALKRPISARLAIIGKPNALRLKK